jgi:voltage-gated potassium channel
MSQTTVFEPVTLKDVKETLGRLLPQGLKGIDQSAPGLVANPCRNTLALVGLTSLIFYMAERGHNPKVNSILDASIYCSTCLSVGYGDIFAKTPVGKMIGTLLMTIGPAMVTKTLDGPAPASADETQAKILETLREILSTLEEQRPAATVS